MEARDEVCSVHSEFEASPRRLLAAVLATNPPRFKLISARGSEMYFSFRLASRLGHGKAPKLLALITAGPSGSQLLVVHEERTAADPDPVVLAAMEDFMSRVRFAYDHPSAGELVKRRSQGT